MTWACNTKHSYCYNNAGTVLNNGRFTKDAKLTFKEGDTITFILKCKEKTITICKNHDKQEILFKNITTGDDIKYSFGISLYMKNDCVSYVSTVVEKIWIRVKWHSCQARYT